MARRKRRRFTARFKADAVHLVAVSGKTIAEVTMQFDLTETARRDWVKRAEADAGGGCRTRSDSGAHGVGRGAQTGEACRDGARDSSPTFALRRLYAGVASAPRSPPRRPRVAGHSQRSGTRPPLQLMSRAGDCLDFSPARRESASKSGWAPALRRGSSKPLA